MFDLKQLISDPTRVMHTSASCTDLVPVSDKEKITQSGVIKTGMTNHYLTFCTRKVSRGVFSGHNCLKIRSMKKYCVSDFNNRLNAADWTRVIDLYDVEKAWTSFKDLFLSVLNTVASNRFALSDEQTPWMTAEILDSIRARELPLLKFRKQNKSKDYKTFARLRNQTQQMVKKAKESYYKAKMEEHKASPKKLWDCLNG